MGDKSGKLRKATGVLLASAALTLLFWDVFVAYNDVAGDTISEIVRDLSHAWWSLPFVFGVITGHFFWNRPKDEMLPRDEHIKVFFTRVVGLSSLVIGRDLLNLAHPLPAFPYANLVFVIAGFFVGARWWPQHLPEVEELSSPDQ